MKEGFNAAGRRAVLAALPTEYDLIVVGGGINGCGAALEAARRGLRVFLLEKGDLGSGTSSGSSRLIHGGLRYLKYGHLKMVWEGSLERHHLRSRFPHLVRPLEFLIPVYEDAGESLPATLFGLGMYDLLSAYTTVRRHRRLSPAEVLAEEPRLRTEGLRGGGVYYDCKTDDFRLVLLNARRAHRAGAHLVPYAEATGLLWEGRRVAGVEFVDRLTGTPYRVRGKAVLNATGAWSDAVRAWASRDGVLRPTKGVHLYLPRERVGHRHAVVMRAPRDERVVFAIPWGELTLVGTTDTDYRGDPDAVRAEREDVDYLLEAVNRHFPAAGVAAADVVSTYAALRPLVGRRDGPEEAVSRSHRILGDAPGLVSVVGGKLTTYRRVTERAVGRTVRELPGEARPGRGGPRAGPPGEPPDRLRERLRRAAQGLDLDEATLERMTTAYGPRIDELVPYLRRDGAARRLVPGLPYRWGEVDYAVEREMALRLMDVLVRRTHVLHEDPAHGTAVAEGVARRMGALLNWDEERRAAELRAFEEAVATTEAFRGGA